MVFVLDRHKKPLMPCTPKRARLLLARKRAVVHRISPFVIRLKDRRVQESRLQTVALKIDPGSKTTGMAIVRQEATEEGPHDHALHLAEVRHRGAAVHQAMLERAAHRRRRRSVNLRYREPRFNSRTRAAVAPALACLAGRQCAELDAPLRQVGARQAHRGGTRRLRCATAAERGNQRPRVPAG